MDSFEYDVFLSFARVDEPLVRPIWEHLSASGLRVFWSEASLQERLGDSWFEAIERSLERSRHFLLVCTPASIASKWVMREYRAFHTHCYRPDDRRLVPLLVSGFDPARLPLLMRELEARALDGADSLRVVARMLGGADPESDRARRVVLEEENATLRATVERLNAEIERLRAPAPAEPPREPPRPPDRWPETAPSAADPRLALPWEEVAAPPPAPAPDDPVLKAVRGWVEEVKVEWHYTIADSPVRDENSRDVFGFLQWALPGTGRDEVVAALRSFLGDPRPEVRWKAMRLLTYYQFDDAAGLRDFWSREKYTASRELVLEAVALLPQPEALDLVLDIARHDQSRRVRQQALKLLPSYASHPSRGRVVGVLMEALTDADAGVREHAVNALAEAKATESIMAASQMALKDSSSTVRRAAVQLLAEVAPIESFGLALKVFPGGSGLGGEDPGVKRCISRFTQRFGQAAMLAYVASLTDARRTAIEDLVRKSGTAVTTA